MALGSHFILGQKCLKICPPNLDPVCGSDGITYDNICHFEVSACKNGALSFAHDGPCTGLRKQLLLQKRSKLSNAS